MTNPCRDGLSDKGRQNSVVNPNVSHLRRFSQFLQRVRQDTFNDGNVVPTCQFSPRRKSYPKICDMFEPTGDGTKQRSEDGCNSTDLGFKNNSPRAPVPGFSFRHTFLSKIIPGGRNLPSVLPQGTSRACVDSKPFPSGTVNECLQEGALQRSTFGRVVCSEHPWHEKLKGLPLKSELPSPLPKKTSGVGRHDPLLSIRNVSYVKLAEAGGGTTSVANKCESEPPIQFVTKKDYRTDQYVMSSEQPGKCSNKSKKKRRCTRIVCRISDSPIHRGVCRPLEQADDNVCELVKRRSRTCGRRRRSRRRRLNSALVDDSEVILRGPRCWPEYCPPYQLRFPRFYCDDDCNNFPVPCQPKQMEPQLPPPPAPLPPPPVMYEPPPIPKAPLKPETSTISSKSVAAVKESKVEVKESKAVVKQVKESKVEVKQVKQLSKVEVKQVKETKCKASPLFKPLKKPLCCEQPQRTYCDRLFKYQSVQQSVLPPVKDQKVVKVTKSADVVTTVKESKIVTKKTVEESKVSLQKTSDLLVKSAKTGGLEFKEKKHWDISDMKPGGKRTSEITLKKAKASHVRRESPRLVRTSDGEIIELKPSRAKPEQTKSRAEDKKIGILKKNEVANEGRSMAKHSEEKTGGRTVDFDELVGSDIKRSIVDKKRGMLSSVLDQRKTYAIGRKQEEEVLLRLREEALKHLVYDYNSHSPFVPVQQQYGLRSGQPFRDEYSGSQEQKRKKRSSCDGRFMWDCPETVDNRSGAFATSKSSHARVRTESDFRTLYIAKDIASPRFARRKGRSTSFGPFANDVVAPLFFKPTKWEVQAARLPRRGRRGIVRGPGPQRGVFLHESGNEIQECDVDSDVQLSSKCGSCAQEDTAIQKNCSVETQVCPRRSTQGTQVCTIGDETGHPLNRASPASPRQKTRTTLCMGRRKGFTTYLNNVPFDCEQWEPQSVDASEIEGISKPFRNFEEVYVPSVFESASLKPGNRIQGVSRSDFLFDPKKRKGLDFDDVAEWNDHMWQSQSGFPNIAPELRREVLGNQLPHSTSNRSRSRLCDSGLCSECGLFNKDFLERKEPSDLELPLRRLSHNSSKRKRFLGKRKLRRTKLRRRKLLEKGGDQLLFDMLCMEHLIRQINGSKAKMRFPRHVRKRGGQRRIRSRCMRTGNVCVRKVQSEPARNEYLKAMRRSPSAVKHKTHSGFLNLQFPFPSAVFQGLNKVASLDFSDNFNCFHFTVSPAASTRIIAVNAKGPHVPRESYPMPISTGNRTGTPQRCASDDQLFFVPVKKNTAKIRAIENCNAFSKLSSKLKILYRKSNFKQHFPKELAKTLFRKTDNIFLGGKQRTVMPCRTRSSCEDVRPASDADQTISEVETVGKAGSRESCSFVPHPTCPILEIYEKCPDLVKSLVEHMQKDILSDEERGNIKVTAFDAALKPQKLRKPGRAGLKSIEDDSDLSVFEIYCSRSPKRKSKALQRKYRSRTMSSKKSEKGFAKNKKYICSSRVGRDLPVMPPEVSKSVATHLSSMSSSSRLPFSFPLRHNEDFELGSFISNQNPGVRRWKSRRSSGGSPATTNVSSGKNPSDAFFLLTSRAGTSGHTSSAIGTKCRRLRQTYRNITKSLKKNSLPIFKIGVHGKIGKMRMCLDGSFKPLDAVTPQEESKHLVLQDRKRGQDFVSKVGVKIEKNMIVQGSLVEDDGRERCRSPPEPYSKESLHESYRPRLSESSREGEDDPVTHLSESGGRKPYRIILPMTKAERQVDKIRGEKNKNCTVAVLNRKRKQDRRPLSSIYSSPITLERGPTVALHSDTYLKERVVHDRHEQPDRRGGPRRISLGDLIVLPSGKVCAKLVVDDDKCYMRKMMEKWLKSKDETKAQESRRPSSSDAFSQTQDPPVCASCNEASQQPVFPTNVPCSCTASNLGQPSQPQGCCCSRCTHHEGHHGAPQHGPAPQPPACGCNRCSQVHNFNVPGHSCTNCAQLSQPSCSRNIPENRDNVEYSQCFCPRPPDCGCRKIQNICPCYKTCQELRQKHIDGLKAMTRTLYIPESECMQDRPLFKKCFDTSMLPCPCDETVDEEMVQEEEAERFSLKQEELRIHKGNETQTTVGEEKVEYDKKQETEVTAVKGVREAETAPLRRDVLPSQRGDGGEMQRRGSRGGQTPMDPPRGRRRKLNVTSKCACHYRGKRASCLKDCVNDIPYKRRDCLNDIPLGRGKCRSIESRTTSLVQSKDESVAGKKGMKKRRRSKDGRQIRCLKKKSQAVVKNRRKSKSDFGQDGIDTDESLDLEETCGVRRTLSVCERKTRTTDKRRKGSDVTSRHKSRTYDDETTEESEEVSETGNPRRRQREKGRHSKGDRSGWNVSWREYAERLREEEDEGDGKENGGRKDHSGRGGHGVHRARRRKSPSRRDNPFESVITLMHHGQKEVSFPRRCRIPPHHSEELEERRGHLREDKERKKKLRSGNVTYFHMTRNQKLLPQGRVQCDQDLENSVQKRIHSRMKCAFPKVDACKRDSGIAGRESRGGKGLLHKRSVISDRRKCLGDQNGVRERLRRGEELTGSEDGYFRLSSHRIHRPAKDRPLSLCGKRLFRERNELRGYNRQKQTKTEASGLEHARNSGDFLQLRSQTAKPVNKSMVQRRKQLPELGDVRRQVEQEINIDRYPAVHDKVHRKNEIAPQEGRNSLRSSSGQSTMEEGEEHSFSGVRRETVDDHRCAKDISHRGRNLKSSVDKARTLIKEEFPPRHVLPCHNVSRKLSKNFVSKPGCSLNVSKARLSTGRARTLMKTFSSTGSMWSIPESFNEDVSSPYQAHHSSDNSTSAGDYFSSESLDASLKDDVHSPIQENTKSNDGDESCVSKEQSIWVGSNQSVLPISVELPRSSGDINDRYYSASRRSVTDTLPYVSDEGRAGQGSNDVDDAADIDALPPLVSKREFERKTKIILTSRDPRTKMPPEPKGKNRIVHENDTIELYIDSKGKSKQGERQQEESIIIMTKEFAEVMERQPRVAKCPCYVSPDEKQGKHAIPKTCNPCFRCSSNKHGLLPGLRNIIFWKANCCPLIFKENIMDPAFTCCRGRKIIKQIYVDVPWCQEGLGGRPKQMLTEREIQLLQRFVEAHRNKGKSEPPKKKVSKMSHMTKPTILQKSKLATKFKKKGKVGKKSMSKKGAGAKNRNTVVTKTKKSKRVKYKKSKNWSDENGGETKRKKQSNRSGRERRRALHRQKEVASWYSEGDRRRRDRRSRPWEFSSYEERSGSGTSFSSRNIFGDGSSVLNSNAASFPRNTLQTIASSIVSIKTGLTHQTSTVRRPGFPNISDQRNGLTACESVGHQLKEENFEEITASFRNAPEGTEKPLVVEDPYPDFDSPSLLYVSYDKRRNCSGDGSNEISAMNFKDIGDRSKREHHKRAGCGKESPFCKTSPNFYQRSFLKQFRSLENDSTDSVIHKTIPHGVGQRESVKNEPTPIEQIGGEGSGNRKDNVSEHQLQADDGRPGSGECQELSSKEVEKVVLLKRKSRLKSCAPALKKKHVQDNLQSHKTRSKELHCHLKQRYDSCNQREKAPQASQNNTRQESVAQFGKSEASSGHARSYLHKEQTSSKMHSSVPFSNTMSRILTAKCSTSFQRKENGSSHQDSIASRIDHSISPILKSIFSHSGQNFVHALNRKHENTSKSLTERELFSSGKRCGNVFSISGRASEEKTLPSRLHPAPSSGHQSQVSPFTTSMSNFRIRNSKDSFKMPPVQLRLENSRSNYKSKWLFPP